MSDHSTPSAEHASRRPRRVARVITGVAVAAAVACLAASGLPAWATSRTPGLPAKDAADWRMPLDRFIPESLVARDYAENLATVPCMARAGFDWPIPKRDIEAAANRIGDVTVGRPLTEQAAATRGYRPAPTDDPGLEATMELNAKPISDSEGAALADCLKEVRASLPLPSLAEQEAGRDAVLLSNAAFDAAEHDASVIDAARAWRTCMTTSGVRDLLPDSPAEMPSPAIADRLGMALSTIRPEEKELALTDVRCQRSSGYRQALYDAEWARQSVVPAHDAELFSRVGDRISTGKTAVYDTIAAHQGGS